MRPLYPLLATLFLGMAIAANAQTIGDLASGSNNLSQMITEAQPITGHCAPLNLGEDGSDVLREYTKASVYFKQGRFTQGWYRGYLQGGPVGEFVYYKVVERKCDGELRQITRAGRCGNPAIGRYWYAYPKAIEKIVEKTVEVVKEVIREVEKPVPVEVEKIVERLVPCQPEITVNITNTTVCPPARREAPRIASLGATRTTTQTRGATLGAGVVRTRVCAKNPLCTDYPPPDKPVPPPNVPPDPAAATH